MVDSITLTRQGWIKHLAMMQEMLKLVGSLHGNVSMSFPTAACEKERQDKIVKAFAKLQELVWETGAVSERIHRERGMNDPDFDALDRDMMNEVSERMRCEFHCAARELEYLARELWDEDAPEVETREVIYPGPVESPDPEEDPNQLRLGLKPTAARIDYKMNAANDDTTTPEEKKDDE